MDLKDIFEKKKKFFEDRIASAKRNSEACDNVIATLDKLGLTGDLVISPSLEDLIWVEFPLDNSSVSVSYDRRWIGFPELNEYDHMQDWILAQFGKVSKYES